MNLCVFEGPQSARMPGWRHYLVLDVDTGRKVSWMATAHAGQSRAERNGWRFFPAGTWEAPEIPDPPFATPIPRIRPEILAKLNVSEPQTSLAF